MTTYSNSAHCRHAANDSKCKCFIVLIGNLEEIMAKHGANMKQTKVLFQGMYILYYVRFGPHEHLV